MTLPRPFFALTSAAATICLDVPVDLGRDEARGLARAELANPRYEDDPSMFERLISWVLTKVGEFLERAADVSPGGWAGFTILAVMLVLAWFVIRRRVGPLARSGGRTALVFGDTPRSARDHRAAADAAADAGDFATAVVERFRAIVRALEERDVLDVRPGRTVGEVVAEATGTLPDGAAALKESGSIFADVRYGGHPATVDHDVHLRAADSLIAAARPVPQRAANDARLALPR